MLQLRITSSTGPRVGYEWCIVDVDVSDDHVSEGSPPIEVGFEEDLETVSRNGFAAFKRALTTPAGPVRHEWQCSCDATLVLEVHRSKKNLYSWDSPREIICNCGRVYGVKLNFKGNPGLPIVEPLYRTTR
jgi:hypothetical protein